LKKELSRSWPIGSATVSAKTRMQMPKVTQRSRPSRVMLGD
jgi:hypothetical protein